MEAPMFNHLIIPYLVAMFLAINMGGSGTAPAFSSAYGAGVIRKNLIPGLFGIMVLLGAILAGKATATTISSGIISSEYLNYSVTTLILLSIALSLLMANLLGVPQSTSQATVLSVSAAASYLDVLNRQKLFFEIIPTWLILPAASFLICFLAGRYIYHPLRKKGLFLSPLYQRNRLIDGLIIAMSLYMAFAIGANNVANAAGPIARMTLNELHINENPSNTLLIIILSTLLIAPNFGIGSSIFGHKIVSHTGKEIILFGKFEAIIIAFVSASLLLTASLVKGIPSSLVQVNVAAIIGIGVAKLGSRNIFKKTEVSQFFIVWLIAPLMAYAITYLGMYLLDHYRLL
ncbi:MAG: inorganic phosphate transporter [Bacteroidota bacterium]